MADILGALGEGAVIAITIRAIDEFSKGINDAEIGITGLKKSTELTMTAVVAAGATAIKVMGDLAVQAAEAGDIQTAFNKTIGDDSIWKQMQTNVLNTVDKFQLMAVANSAVNRGLKAETLPTIAAFAQRLADADPQFKDVTASMNDLTSAIATGRLVALKRMGVMADEQTILDSYAKKQLEQIYIQKGVNLSMVDLTEETKNYVKGMTEAEKKTALQSGIMDILNQKIKTMAPPTVDAADKMKQLTARFTEAKVQIGTALEPAFSKLVDSIMPMIPTISKIITDLLPVLNALLWVTKEVLFFLEAGFDAVSTAVEGWTWAITDTIRVFKEWIDQIKSLLDWINKILAPLREVSSLLGGLGGGVKPISMPTVRKVGDAIIRPNGDIIETNPNDTLIATQNPDGTGIIINIQSVYGMNPKDLSVALKKELSTKISI